VFTLLGSEELSRSNCPHAELKFIASLVICYSTNQSIYLSVKQTNKQSINQSINHHFINQSDKQSICQILHCFFSFECAELQLTV